MTNNDTVKMSHDIMNWMFKTIFNYINTFTPKTLILKLSVYLFTFILNIYFHAQYI